MEGGVFEVEGERLNSTWYHVNDGYFYTAANSNKNRVFLKCKVPKCKGRASMPLRPDERRLETFKNTIPHCHDPDFHQQTLLELRRKILERCSNEVTPFLTIWNEEIARIDVQSMTELAGRITFNSLQSAMYRARTAKQPKIPPTLREYGVALQNTPKFRKTLRGSDFYLSTVESAEGGVSVIFGSPEFMQLLPGVEELHLDGTFKVRPTVPPSRQMLTIMSMHLSHAFPVFFILMEKKNEAAYTDVLKFIKLKVPLLNPSVFITDFERAIQNSLSNEFPGKEVVGCWFHSATDMRKKARKLGLGHLLRENPMAKKVLKMGMALPLLPSNKIAVGFDAIKDFAIEKGVHERTEGFLRYVYRTWIQGVGSERLSVYRQKRRTNNHQESFHNCLRHLMKGPHPNIWIFTECLQKTEQFNVQKYQSMLHGQAGGRSTSKKNILQDKSIKRATDQLDNGDATVLEFLQIVAHRVDFVDVELGSDGEEEDIIDVFERDENPERMDRNMDLHQNDFHQNEAANEPVDVEVEDGNNEEGEAEELPENDEVFEIEDSDDELNLAAEISAREMQLRRQVDERLEGYRDAVKICLPISYLDVPTRDFVNRQVKMLLSDLTPEENVCDINNVSPECIFCTDHASTRMISPCGHWMGCINCTKKWVREFRCHQVTSADGNVIHMPEYILPVQCPRCNALVGKLLRAYHN